MYVVSEADRPREIYTLPQSSVGAPCPMLIADENALRIGYYVDEDRLTVDWTSASIESGAPDDSDELCAVVKFDFVYSHMFGPPNDEAFTGHPLASRGLSPYGSFEVDHSSWLQSLVRMNEVHPYHRPAQFSELKHFVLSFHDSTFECLAKSFKVSLCRGSLWRVLREAQNAV